MCVRKASVPALIVLFLLGACSILGSDDGRPPPGEYEGFYALGFEVNDFRPCNRDENWWVVGQEEALKELHERYARIRQENGRGRVYVRLRGVPSEKGKFGHLGGSEREFALREVIEVRSVVEADCQ